MKQKSNPLSDYSAKIKNIFIELQDYTYYHGPSEIGDIDNRFMGRADLLKKLKELLINNETKSGAYLVTGYRGMGKSSLVNKVIDEICTSKKNKKKSSRYIRIFLLMSILPFIDFAANNFYFFTFFILPLFFFFFQIFYLIWTDIYRDDLKLSYSSQRRSNVLILLLRTFILEKETVSKTRFRAIISDLYMISIIQLTSLLMINIFGLKLSHTKYLIYVGVYLVLIFSSAIFVRWDTPRMSSVGINLNRTLKDIWHSLKKYISYSQRIYIRINLGHENLKEIDILQLIARNLIKNYERVARAFIPYSFLNLLWKVLKFVLILLVVGTIYYSLPIYKVVNDFKKESGFLNYFPTQGLVLSENDARKEIKKYIFEEKNFKIKDYYKKFYNLNSKIFTNERMKGKSQEIIVYCDLLLYMVYSEIKEFIFPSSFFKKIPFNDIHKYYKPAIKLSKDFYLLPEQLDYLFILTFLLIWMLLNFLTKRYRVLGVTTHHYIFNKLIELNENLSAQIIKERGSNVEGAGLDWKFGFVRKKTRNYPIADVREAEKQLIDILNEIEYIPRVMSRPQFIFIFDELDKIEPHRNISLTQKGISKPIPTENEKSELVSTEGVRRRQFTILAILSNLKHFLTTAKARFLFIAGREMYDASLADISDRHFFMGTIFNEVIYVNSFLTDSSDRKLSDITSMVESYVCQFLLPAKYLKKGASLKVFNNYLKDNFFNDDDHQLDDLERKLNKTKREKIIFTLQDFIIYLTYRSNGAPKKITRYFESYVKNIEKERLLNSSESLCVGHSSANLYLSLGFYDQYIFGMITYLVNPFFLALNKSIKDFGDKLLVSTSFLIDHIYKFHKFGFSWRNLEIMPEIIDVHKAPELRELIGNIIDLLSDIHIQKIVSGLYNFKFIKRIVEEISFLSKISEREAAAFNFTLDESLSSKKHYIRRLMELKQDQRFMEKEDKSKYIHSIGFIHMILGDLYFYDKEYDEAIVEYMESIQTLRGFDLEKDRRIDIFILVIRNMLKLGFTFEKKKSYESAFVTYGMITSIIIKFRFIDLKEIGLKEVIITRDDLKYIRNHKEREKLEEIFRNLEEEKGNGKTKEEDVFLTKLSPLTTEHSDSRVVEEVEPDKINTVREDKFFGLSINLIKQLKSFPYSPTKENLLFKVSTFEGLRLIYQPFVSRFQVAEKANLGGITRTDIETVHKQFKYLTKLISESEKFIICSEFYDKIGDILYYKNGLVPDFKGDEPCCLKSRSLCSKNMHAEKMITEKGLKIPCQACHFYMESLRFLVKDYLNIEDKKESRENIITGIFEGLEKEIKKEYPLSQRAMILKTFGNTLSDLGDCILSCITDEDVITYEFFDMFLECMEKGEYKDKLELLKKYVKRNGEFAKMEEIFFYYYLSATFFRNSGERREYSFQIIKILYLIRDYIAITNKKETFTTDILDKLGKIILKRAIRSIYRIYDNVHRMEISSFQEIFSSEEKPLFQSKLVDLNRISISADIREIILIFLEIKMKTTNLTLSKSISFMSPYNCINSMYARIIELRFAANLNFKIFEDLGFDNLKKNSSIEEFNNIFRGKSIRINSIFGKEIDPGMAMEFLIADSIFCLHEMIKICKIFGNSYMIVHSVWAIAHKELASWCTYYFNYLRNCSKEAEERIQENLKEKIGLADFNILSPNYHFEQALKHFRMAKETHSEGNAYNRIIENMYYLDDDFNDSLFHFCAAMERYKINSGKINKDIDSIKEKLEQSSVYDHKNYYKK